MPVKHAVKSTKTPRPVTLCCFYYCRQWGLHQSAESYPTWVQFRLLSTRSQSTIFLCLLHVASTPLPAWSGSHASHPARAPFGRLSTCSPAIPIPGLQSRPLSTMSWSDSRRTVGYPPFSLFTLPCSCLHGACRASQVPGRLSLCMPRLVTPAESPHFAKTVLRYWLPCRWTYRPPL